MDKITKLPWEIKKEITDSGYYISSKDELKRDVKLASFLTKEDAEYICLAVNEREKLLKDRDGLVEAANNLIGHAKATIQFPQKDMLELEVATFNMEEALKAADNNDST